MFLLCRPLTSIAADSCKLLAFQFPSTFLLPHFLSRISEVDVSDDLYTFLYSSSSCRRIVVRSQSCAVLIYSLPQIAMSLSRNACLQLRRTCWRPNKRSLDLLQRNLCPSTIASTRRARQYASVSSVSAKDLSFGQPVHETHPHLLRTGECQSTSQSAFLLPL